MRSMDKGIARTGKRARRQLVQEEEEDVQEAYTIGKSGKWSIFILKLVDKPIAKYSSNSGNACSL
jgi:hypothetical protein